MDRHILVTGGAGYIGSHTCKALHEAGYTPVTFDNLVYGHEWAVQWGPLVHGDLCDKVAIRDCFRKYSPEAVIHFAAFAYVGESVTDPSKYYNNNLVSSLNLLDSMREFACDKIVFSSTCAVYGQPDQIPLTEELPCRPINPYGHSKYFIEQIMNDYAAAYSLRPASLRYFNAAGADPDGLIGESHSPETHLIPLALNACQPGADPITVFGTDWDTPDGTCVRDYIHVADLADAHLLALKYLENHQSAVFNLGNGNGHSVKDILDTAARVTNNPVNWQPGPRRAGDPPMLIANADRAKKELGWSPRFNDLNDIMTHAWNWMENNEKVQL